MNVVDAMHSRDAASRSSIVLMLAVLALVIALTPSITFGQSTSSSIVGTVTDESGAAVPGVAITVTNVGTQAVRNVETNARGDYSVTALDIGLYEVAAELEGFSLAVATDIRLEVDSVRRQNLTLEIGAVTEQITVRAHALTIQTDDTTISTVIDADKIRELPIPGDRNLFRLALLAPGMSRGPRTSVTTSGFGPGYGIAALGQKVHNNNIILDGAPLRTGIHGMVRMRPSVEAVSEFRVEAGWYNAELGTQSGAQIITSIRSGTNDFHGTLFQFFRAEELDARNFFENDPSIKKRPLTRNTFGAVVSGPIVENKLFFTANVEIFRERRSGQGFAIYPSPLMRQGELTEPFFAGSPILDIATCTDPADASTCGSFANNIIPQSRISPIAQNVIRFWPQPNFGSPQFDGKNNFSATTKNDLNDHQFFLRNDWNINDKNKIFGRYGIQDIRPASVGVLASTDARFTRFNPKRQQNATLTWTRFLTNTALNELRVSYNRDVFNRTSGFTDTGWSNLTELGIPGQTEASHDARPTSISVTGCCGFGAGDVNQIWDESRMIADDLSFIKGNHSIKMGVSYNLVRTARRTIQFANGAFSFNGVHSGVGFADFLLDQPQSVRLGNVPGKANAGTFPEFDYWRLHPYIQDAWKMTPNLTLNVGMRWEYNSPFQDKRGESRNFDMGTGSLFPEPGVTADLNTVSKNNWAPRFGIAWRPMGGTDLVVRTGYGIFYNVNMINNFVPSQAANPPGTLRIEEIALARRPVITMATADQAQNQLIRSSIFGANTENTVGFVQQWNLNIQKTLPWSLVGEIGYSGSKSDHFDMPAEYNAFLPNTIGTANPTRRWPQFSSIEILDTAASGTYHGLLTKLERRFSGGLTFLQTYTWSKVMFDFRACCGAERPNNPHDRRTAERGRGDFDITHRTTTAFLWELPFGKNLHGAAKYVLGGWQVNGVLLLATGLPIHPNQGRTDPTPGDGCSRCSRRPYRLADGNLSGSARTLDRWFDTSAFMFASPENRILLGRGLYGDAGRSILEEPGRTNLDFSIFKNFDVAEGHRIQFRWEMYNATNTPPFLTPQRNIQSGNFGRVTSALSGREMQLGLRWQF